MAHEKEGIAQERGGHSTGKGRKSRRKWGDIAQEREGMAQERGP